jgi:hypothetical protein
MAKLLMSEALVDLRNVLRDAKLSAETNLEMTGAGELEASFWSEVTGEANVEEGPGRTSLLSLTIESIEVEGNGDPRDLPVRAESMRDSDCPPPAE